MTLLRRFGCHLKTHLSNCLALRHEPAYERPRFGRLRMREVHPGWHPTTLYHGKKRKSKYVVNSILLECKLT